MKNNIACLLTVFLTLSFVIGCSAPDIRTLDSFTNGESPKPIILHKDHRFLASFKTSNSIFEDFGNDVYDAPITLKAGTYNSIGRTDEGTYYIGQAQCLDSIGLSGFYQNVSWSCGLFIQFTDPKHVYVFHFQTGEPGVANVIGGDMTLIFQNIGEKSFHILRKSPILISTLNSDDF